MFYVGTVIKSEAQHPALQLKWEVYNKANNLSRNIHINLTVLRIYKLNLHKTQFLTCHIAEVALS